MNFSQTTDDMLKGLYNTALNRLNKQTYRSEQEWRALMNFADRCETEMDNRKTANVKQYNEYLTSAQHTQDLTAMGVKEYPYPTLTH